MARPTAEFQVLGWFAAIAVAVFIFFFVHALILALIFNPMFWVLVVLVAAWVKLDS